MTTDEVLESFEVARLYRQASRLEIQTSSSIPQRLKREREAEALRREADRRFDLHLSELERRVSRETEAPRGAVKPSTNTERR